MFHFLGAAGVLSVQAFSWLNSEAGNTTSKLAVPVTRNQLALENILVSHGSLIPPFRPDISTYNLNLDRPLRSIGLVPVMDYESVSSLDSSSQPLINFNWQGYEDPDAEPSCLSVQKQIPLPENGGTQKLSITLTSPVDGSQNFYRINVHQMAPPPPGLRYITGVDSNQRQVLGYPIVNEDVTIYHAYIDPKADWVNFDLACTRGSTMYIDGVKTSSPTTKKIKRDKTRHSQVLQVDCSNTIDDSGKQYAVIIQSDYAYDDILPPRLIVDDTGEECVFEKGQDRYLCPDPKTVDGLIRMVSYNEPTIKHLLKNRSGSTEVRLLDGKRSIPFTYGAGLYIDAISGQSSRQYPIYFQGYAIASILTTLGYILAFLVLLLIVVLFFIVGISSTLGLGVPLGATEIVAAFTFIIQYLCFTTFMSAGTPTLNSLIKPLKWLTLFWPLPWTTDVPVPQRKLLDFPDFPLSTNLWDNTRLGDAADVRNAFGCMFWSEIIFAALILLHLTVIANFTLSQRDYTFPHRISFGNWESRCLHWLAFPSSVGCSMVMNSDVSNIYWKIFAGCIMVFHVYWLIRTFVAVQGAVTSKKVCWIWQHSVREDGDLEDEAGYWADVVADQLQSQPVNRAVCGGLFPYRWISTVADITPVTIAQAFFDNESVYPPTKFAVSNVENTYPLAKNPQVVEVTKCRAPGSFCGGTRLIAGLLRSQWLDLLFTYRGLCNFHARVCKGSTVTVPLIVKTAQLSGPLASGANAFFFDGARVPFIRIADYAYKMFIGIFIGVALAATSATTDAIMFSLITSLSIAMLSYVAVVMPYSRKKENWLCVFVCSVVAISAACFLFFTLRDEDPQGWVELFLVPVAVCCFVLAGYGVIVTVSTLAAFVCPPLEETRFLEKLANCSAVISDSKEGWIIDLPAYSKYPLKDHKVQVAETGERTAHITIFSSGEEPVVEIAANDLAVACRTGYLSPPICCVYSPDDESLLGYRYLSVNQKKDVQAVVTDFFRKDRALRSVAEQLGRDLAHHVSIKGRGKHVMCFTILPPK